MVKPAKCMVKPAKCMVQPAEFEYKVLTGCCLEAKFKPFEAPVRSWSGFIEDGDDVGGWDNRLQVQVTTSILHQQNWLITLYRSPDLQYTAFI